MDQTRRSAWTPETAGLSEACSCHSHRCVAVATAATVLHLLFQQLAHLSVSLSLSASLSISLRFVLQHNPTAHFSCMTSSSLGDRPPRQPCIIGEPSLGGGSLSHGRGDWQTTCLSILKKVEDQLGQSISIFNAPVDVKIYTEYPKYVDKPMDLGTIRGRLDKGIYRDPQEFCNVSPEHSALPTSHCWAS